jgi:hypothetical protein
MPHVGIRSVPVASSARATGRPQWLANMGSGTQNDLDLASWLSCFDANSLSVWLRNVRWPVETQLGYQVGYGRRDSQIFQIWICFKRRPQVFGVPHGTSLKCFKQQTPAHYSCPWEIPDQSGNWTINWRFRQCSHLAQQRVKYQKRTCWWQGIGEWDEL